MRSWGERNQVRALDADRFGCARSPGTPVTRTTVPGHSLVSGEPFYAPVEIDTVPVKPSYTIVTFRKNVRPIKAL